MPDREGEQGSGIGLGQQMPATPAPASTRAASSANSADRCRASPPTATLTLSPPLRAPPTPSLPLRGPLPRGPPPSPGPLREAAPAPSSSQPAPAAVAALTTARFIRFGPAAITPRSPAVPTPAARRTGPGAQRAPRHPPRERQLRRPDMSRPSERLQLGPVPRVGVILDPGLDHGPELILTRHLPHPSLTSNPRPSIGEDSGSGRIWCTPGPRILP